MEHENKSTMLKVGEEFNEIVRFLLDQGMQGLYLKWMAFEMLIPVLISFINPHPE